MFHEGALNNHYAELLGATAMISKASPSGMTTGRAIEFMADVMPLGYPTTQAALGFLGTTVRLGWFEMDAPTTNTTRIAPVRFGTIRNAVAKYSGDGSLTLGERTVLYGKDDGSNVTAWQDRVPLGSATAQADWTAAQAAFALTAPTTLYFGHDDVVVKYTAMRLFEAWIKVNGVRVLHYRPKWTMRGGTTLTDLSDFGNNGTLAGTENTDWRIARAFARAPVSVGGPAA